MNGLERLNILRHQVAANGGVMAELRPRFEAIRNREIEGTAPKAVTGFNLFQTPPEIAARMASIVQGRVKAGGRILEPSAGLGRLYEPLEGLDADWVMVEEAAECCNALKKALKRVKEVKQADFLTQTAEALGGQFDAVVMNPPFKQGRDIKHILHALGMVKPGGMLVALCYNGVKQNEQLKGIATSWEVLPEGSFKDEGTGASVAMIVIEKGHYEN